MNVSFSSVATLTAAAAAPMVGFAAHQYAVSHRSSMPLFAQTLAATSEKQIRDFFPRPQSQSIQEATPPARAESTRKIAPHTRRPPQVDNLKLASAAQAIASMARTLVAKTHSSGTAPPLPITIAEAVDQRADTVGEPNINNHDVWVTEPYASTVVYAGWDDTCITVTPHCSPAYVRHQAYWFY